MTLTTNSAWVAQLNLSDVVKPILILDAEGNRWRFARQWRETPEGIEAYIHASRNGEYYPSSDVGAFVLLCDLIDAQRGT